jgi:receptor protein-tyrosine kinase
MTDQPTPRYATLGDYLRVVREHKWLILVVTALFAAAAFAVTSREKKTYVAEAAVAFQDPTADLSLLGTNASPIVSPEQRAAEGSEQVTRPAVLARARRDLHGTVSLAQLQSSVTVRAETRTSFVVIQASGRDPRQVARIANAMARAVQVVETNTQRARFAAAAQGQSRRLKEVGRNPAASFARSALIDRISRLQALQDFARPVEITRSATVPSLPASPRPVRNTLLGALLGLTLALIAAFVRDSLDRRMRSGGDVEDQLGLPLLGQLGASAMGRTFTGDGKRPMPPQEIESARMLRVGLDFLDVDRDVRVIVVTSALPEEGKSTVASSLAYASALTGKRTLLIEADLRRPSLAERVGAKTAPGLADRLARKISLQDAVQQMSVGPAQSRNGDGEGPPDGPAHSFDVITAGTRTPSPAELLGSDSFTEMLKEARESYDLVVIDSSPLMVAADTMEIVPQVDGVILCVRHKRTKREEAQAAKRMLDRFPARPTGVVVTGARAKDRAYYGPYAGGYGYGSD